MRIFSKIYNCSAGGPAESAHSSRISSKDDITSGTKGSQPRGSIFSISSQSKLKRRRSVESMDILSGGRVKKYADSSEEEEEEKNDKSPKKDGQTIRKGSVRFW